MADDEAFATARALAMPEGLMTGQTSGANVAAAGRLAAALGPGTRVATVLVDTGLKYLAGDRYGDPH